MNECYHNVICGYIFSGQNAVTLHPAKKTKNTIKNAGAEIRGRQYDYDH